MPKLTPDQLDPRNNLQYYTKDALKNSEVWTPREMRREYARLRDIAQKRLKRLAVAEPKSYAYRMNKGAYAPTRSLSDAEIMELMPKLAKFIAAKTGTVAGIRRQRRKAVATLNRHGYTGITESNYEAFGDFMDKWHADKTLRSIGSPTVVDAFTFTEERDIPWNKVKDDFAAYLRSQKKLAEYVRKQEAKGNEVTSDMIRDKFSQLNEARLRKNEQARKRRAAKKKQ